MDQRVRAVDVISLCSAEGDIRPLRVRLEEEPFRVDIQDVVSVTEIPYVGVEAQVFLCRATVGKRQWLFELKYYIRSHTWWLLRRIH